MTICLQCIDCRHFDYSAPHGGYRCAAFPDGIPKPILRSKHDHTKPYPGDRGIRFEPIVIEDRVRFVDPATGDTIPRRPASSSSRSGVTKPGG